ncbi:hypothetical protein VP01_8g1 [Puccinia sorghi]|uniref:Alpha-ketoglutarate-dependent dioxygenase AlkB-like domain-containing protein n=1 Tax=Puccinia sorghi TaxID=27349 RepID=A0A0L6U7U0_9BASI|nr:hypothetical protein VP01_8g1 [Puccinia sorghi]
MICWQVDVQHNSSAVLQRSYRWLKPVVIWRRQHYTPQAVVVQDHGRRMAQPLIASRGHHRIARRFSFRAPIWPRITTGNAARNCSTSVSPPIGTENARASQVHTLVDEKCEWFEIPAGHLEAHKGIYEPTDFLLYSRFLTDQEQDMILEHSLSRLDKMERPRARPPAQAGARKPPNQMGSKFRAEEEYSFEPGHFDQVISGYREMQVSQFLSPPSRTTADLTHALELILARLQALLPTSTRPPLLHLLHLASHGKIDPHVDNPEASGSTILGLSLGSTRVMRLGHHSAPTHFHLKVLLPPGSVYLQRDSVRYNLQHSIPSDDSFKDQPIIGAQRLSLMLRVRSYIPSQ